MYVALLWTINDFPAYANLSGWSTKGKLACLICMDDTHYLCLPESNKLCYLGHRRFLPIEHRWQQSKFKDKFDGKPCHYSSKNPKNFRRTDTIRLSGYKIMEKLQQIGNIRLGHLFQKDLKDLPNSRFKKSIFFMELPY